MPKRTNWFQVLVRRIYEQMSATGNSVTESVELIETSSGTAREVDVLLEASVFGIRMRIAVEARGRSRVDDVEWIDSLIGKYRDLDVHKVFAVSKSGFSKAARAKAKAHGIEAIALSSALETRWPDEFVRLGFAKLERADNTVRVHVICHPPLTSKISSSADLLDENQNLVQPLADALVIVFKTAQARISSELRANFVALYPTLDSLSKQALLTEHTLTPHRTVFVRQSGQLHRVESIALRVLSTFSYESVALRHHLLGRAQVSFGVVSNPRNSSRVTVIQLADKPGEARAYLDPVAPRRTTKKRQRSKRQT